jgi:hypothetical protein
MFNHPVIMMIPVLVFLALAVWLMPKNLSIRQVRISSAARQNAWSQTGPARIDQPSRFANMSLSAIPSNTL